MKRSLVVEDSFHRPDNITSYISFPLFHFSFLSFFSPTLLPVCLSFYGNITCIEKYVVVQLLSSVQLFATCQAPLSVRFSRQEYWSGLPFLSPGDLPDLEIKPVSIALTSGFFTTELPGKSMVQTLTLFLSLLKKRTQYIQILTEVYIFHFKTGKFRTAISKFTVSP